MVPGEYSGSVWFNYRTASGGADGNITEYDMGNGKAGYASIRAASFIKSGGTSSQFLKADGSVDSNTYSLSSHTHSYLPLTGGTLSGDLTVGAKLLFTNSSIDDGTWPSGMWRTSVGLQIAAANNGAKIPITLGWRNDADPAIYIGTSTNVGIGTSSPSQKLEVSGNIKATSFIKSGGTSAQFLKADGSVDSNSYSISSHGHSNYLYTSQVASPQDTTYGDSATNWAITTAGNYPRSYVYNTYGAEYSYLIGMNTNNNYGTILKLGYSDKYLRILRKSSGTWQSEDWEKISAGYADSSGNASTSEDSSKLSGLPLDRFVYSVGSGSFGTSERSGNSEDFERTMFWRDNNKSQIGVFVSHSGGSTYGWEIHAGYSKNSEFSGRVKENGTWGDVRTFITSANYSSYCAPASHTHSYLPLSGGTMSGGASIVVATVHNSSGDVYNGGIQLREYNYSTTSVSELKDGPGITFHWGGRVVQRLSMSTGTQLYWGNNQIWHAGNLNPSDYSLTSHNHDSTYLKLSGGTMTGAIKYGGASYEIIRTGGDDTSWRGGLKYSWSGNTTIALWGRHANSQFVWHAGTDFSSNDVNGTSTRSYDFQVGRSNGTLEALIGGNKVWHAGNDGSGSGLDADLLDGQHASDFCAKRSSARFYNFIADSNSSYWYKVTLPFQGTTSANNRWMMVSMEIVLKGNYNSGADGKIFLRYYIYYQANTTQGQAESVYGIAIGSQLQSVRVAYQKSNLGIFYIYVPNNYNSIAIQNLSANDSAPAYDFRTTSLVTSAAPTDSDITDISIVRLNTTNGTDLSIPNLTNSEIDTIMS